MILFVVVGRIRVGAGWVLSTVITNLEVGHVLVIDHLERIMVVVLFLLWQVCEYIMAVNHSEQCLELVFYILGQSGVSNSRATKCVHLVCEFW